MKSILINTNKVNVFGVFETKAAAEVAADKCPDNTVLIDEAADLENFSGPELVKIYNSLAETSISKFSDSATAQKRTWKALDELPIGVANKVKKKAKAATGSSSAKRSRMVGEKFRMLPGWAEKKFHEESQRAICFDVILQLTNDGKRQGSVDEYAKKAAKRAGITEKQAMACLAKLIDIEGQKTPTVELV